MFQPKVLKKIKTHFVFRNFFSTILLFLRKRVEQGRPQMTI
jgi:hypothetical protein